MTVDLYWLPLGAGGNRCVPWSGRRFEAIMARRERRAPADLYHSALEVRLSGELFTIEMAPVWSLAEPADRGVVGEGPVGLPRLGRSRLFRYEVRRWRNGRIPDLATAVGGPRRLSGDPPRARRLLGLVPHVPLVTWGRDELRTGEMWNSNSLIAWLLASSGHPAQEPPPPGRAPGGAAGVVLAARQAQRCHSGPGPAWRACER
ncbi:MAG: hypothetical protein ABW022_24540 [Actinoplanes sp.]